MIDLRGVWPEWEPVEKIGEGSYGTVYKCKKIENGEEIFSAVKVITVPKNESEYEGLRIDGFTNEASKQYFADIIESFSSEIKLLEELKDQPNIVRIEDSKIVEYDDTIRWDIYIRMELLTGFRDYSEEHAMTQNDVIRLGADICSALEACEKKKIIHRDIKPENIFVDKDGNFKLGDFGVARQLEKTNTTMSQKGTYNYMAPEVVFKKKYDKRADVYSLGMVMYKLLNNNREPFVDPDKQMIRYKDRVEAMDRRLKNERLPAPKNADENLAQIILKACEFNKEKRISSAQEFKKLLLSLDSGKKVRIKKKVSKKVGLAVACVAAVAVILTSLNYIIPMIISPDDPPTDEISPEVYYGEITDSGICGQDVNYAFYQESGTLVLSGSGETFNYYTNDSSETLFLEDIPWHNYSQKIQTIKIEEGITKIGSCLFNNCLILSEVVLPETLTEIGTGAFSDCSSLTQLSIPDSVIKINSSAFYKCIHLDDVKMSKNILSVGLEAFSEIGEAGEDDGTCFYIGGVLIEYMGLPILEEEEKTYTVLDGTRIIADGAFCSAEDCELTEVIIPNSVISIGNGAFSDCITLEKIALSDGLKRIDSAVFFNCENLSEIKIPQSIEYIGESAFTNCYNLKTIDLPDKAFDICQDVFSETAYYNNQSNWLGNCLYIGNHLVNISSEGFGEIKVREGTLTFTMFGFENCGEYTKLYIPSSVELISSINTCFNSIDVAEDNNYYSSSDGVIFDKKKTKLIAFPLKKEVDSYKIPDSVKEICQEAFINCGFLQKIEFPDDLEKIGDSAFRSSGLISVTIPDKIKTLPKDVFWLCEKLTSVNIPQSVCEIKTGAFQNCSSLEKIELPDGLKYIATGLFSNSGLKSISIPAGVKQLSPSSFESCVQLKKIELPNGIKRIPSLCFAHCKSLESPNLPETLTEIGSESFINCDSIKKLLLHNNLMLIDCYAFSNCVSLTEVILPESLETVEEYAFYNCRSLKSVTVPANVTSVGAFSFGYLEEDDLSVPDSSFVLKSYINSAANNYAANFGLSCPTID